jgi:pimeloyl-ACP methyl ester carboxylesterase
MTLALFMLAVGVAAAQDTTPSPADITLTPFTDDTFHIMGVVPEGWAKIGPGLYRRGSSSTDITLIAEQAAPGVAEQIIPALLPQLGLDKLPDSVATLEAGELTWTLYKVDVQAGSLTVAVDLALAESENKTYIVLFQTAPEEYDALHDSVFLPAVNALARAPEATPEPNLPYAVEDVTFANGDVTLAGTLTLPEGDGPHPALILVTGSGPQDRDESLAPVSVIKPFKLIADYLTRQGIAVLRYDDRGVGKSTGDFAKATLDDFTADASAAIDYLLTRNEIDPGQIGLLGHSEGGEVASKLGATNSHLAFIIGMAAPAVKGDALMMVQNRRVMLAEGGTEEQAKQQQDYLRQVIDLINADDLESFKTLTHDFVLAQAQTLPEDQRAALGDLEVYAQARTDQAVAGYFNNWFRTFLGYDPSPDWAKTTIPVLGLYGKNDVQVDAEQNAPALEAALKQAGNTDYQVVTLPTANHLFQDAKTGGVSEYGTLPAEFTSEFLPTVGDWILEHVELPA